MNYLNKSLKERRAEVETRTKVESQDRTGPVAEEKLPEFESSMGIQALVRRSTRRGFQ